MIEHVLVVDSVHQFVSGNHYSPERCVVPASLGTTEGIQCDRICEVYYGMRFESISDMVFAATTSMPACRSNSKER